MLVGDFEEVGEVVEFDVVVEVYGVVVVVSGVGMVFNGWVGNEVWCVVRLC